MFKAIIAKRARVPAGDSFIVKRVAGPGLASNFFYQIKTEQALVALEARMEVAEVEAYKVCEIFISLKDSSLMLHKWLLKDLLRIRFGSLEVAA